jgi:outer membrane protein assembly factor BamB
VTEAWVQRYNNKWVSNSEDEATKVVRDTAGDIIVTGSTDDGLFGPDMLTIKYSGTDGTVLWHKRYNGPANSADSPSALALDTSGNVVVTGYSASFSSGNYYTAKYAAADGALLWEQRTSSEAAAVAVDGSGNVVVTGSSNNGSYALRAGLERNGACSGRNAVPTAVRRLRRWTAAAT